MPEPHKLFRPALITLQFYYNAHLLSWKGSLCAKAASRGASAVTPLATSAAPVTRLPVGRRLLLAHPFLVPACLRGALRASTLQHGYGSRNAVT